MSIKPYFWKQTDARWRNKSYKGMTLGAGGCGPTSIANTISPLLLKNYTPAKVWDYMKKQGFLIPGAGSTWDGITKTLRHYGIEFVVTYDDTKVRDYLKKGWWMIGLCGPSRWTSSGHYITIYKLTSAEKILVSDPYSSSDYCQKDAYLAEYLRCNKCNWIAINPAIYPGGSKSDPPEKETKVVTMYVDTAAANVRKGRGLKYGVKAVVKRGQKLKLYSLQGGWYKIKAGKYKGYYISESVLTRYEPYNHEFKALFEMNVRKGASSKAEIKGTIGKGTRLISSKKSGDWIYFPALKGWVRSISGDKKKTYLKKIK